MQDCGASRFPARWLDARTRREAAISDGRKPTIFHCAA